MICALMTSSESRQLMRPLPVLATIREAYQFTFSHLGSIIGLIWLPMVIVTVAGFFVEQRIAADMIAAQASNDYALLGPTLLGSVVYFLAALLLNAMMYVSVTQLALGQRQGGALVHFALGAPEWRMFRALLGLILFLMPPLFVIVMVMNGLLPANATGPALLAARAAFLAFCCGLIFITVRFAFLIAPVAVAEDKPALARSWSLSAGNFWRMLAVMLGAAGPGVFLKYFLDVTLAALMMPHNVGGLAAMLQQPADLPLEAGLNFLVAPFIIGLGVSASVFSYRALVRTDISA
jgi:hypothetical protein